MKLTILLLTAAFLNVHANGLAQNVTISGKDISLKQIFSAIENQTSYVVLNKKGLLSDSKSVSLTVYDMPLLDLLDVILKDQPVKFSIQGKTIILSRKVPRAIPSTPSATISVLPITGKVQSVDGTSLIGVTIIVKGTRKTVLTDAQGRFSIEAMKGDVLVVSSVGYVTKEIKVESESVISITLEINQKELDEVIFKGYYSESKKLATGSTGKISEAAIRQQPVTNVMGALIGRVSGLEVTQGGGMPGAGFKVRIRGQNSIAAGNDPLYIVDGVPFESSSLSNRSSSLHLPSLSAGLSPFNTLNPSDISTIEILKDADATAIYGSRGSNGVILITTKRGKSGETQFEIQANHSFSKVTRLVKMANTEEYLAIRKQAYANDGVANYPYGAFDVDGTWDQNQYTDWQKELLGGTAKGLNAQLGVSGGSQFTQFLLRGSYHSETTVFPANFKYERGSVLFNVNHRSSNEKFKLSLAVNYATDVNNLSGMDLTARANSIAPNAPALFNAEGSLNWENSTWTNPLAELEAKYNGKTRSLTNNLQLEYRLISNLTFKTSLGYSDYNLDEFRTSPSTQYDPAWLMSSRNSNATFSIGNRQNWIVEPQLNWSFSRGESQIAVLTGMTLQQQNASRNTQIGGGFPNNALIYDLTVADMKILLQSDDLLYKYNAVFARFNYNLKGKYLVNFTARRDGSSRFTPERQFANFGALGSAWLFSEEKWFRERISWISFGKLQASYGIVGNDQIGDYQFLNTYSSDNGNNYQSIVGLLPKRLYNPNFGWESNRKLGSSLDVGFLEDKVYLTATWYKNRSSNQLVGIPLSGLTGFPSIQSNLDAVVQNSGWEFDLQISMINKDNFTWKLSSNLTIPKNKLMSFPGLSTSTYSQTLVVGQPLTIVKRYKITGINPQNGFYQFEDKNNDGSINALHDRIVVRNLASHFYGAINNSLTFKNWQIDFHLQGVKKTGNNYLREISAPGAYINSRIPKYLIDKIWHPGNEDALIQKLATGSNASAMDAWSYLQVSDYAVSSFYYIRLKNLSVSYKVPKQWLNATSATLYMQAQNLFTATDYLGGDPESEMSFNTLPPMRTINVGINLIF